VKKEGAKVIMKYLLIMIAKFVFGSISFKGGPIGAIFGLAMIAWGIYDLVNIGAHLAS
jgi:hypothetical protein